MPFYFRKSVSAGPFRFNLSQHGIGASVGVKGLRIGTGPRGHYVHAGRGGFYYRATIDRPSGRVKGPVPLSSPRQWQPDDSDMIPITSGNIFAMQDSAVADVLQEINTKSRQPRLSFILGSVSLLAALALALNGGAIFLAPALFIAVAGIVLGAWLDSYKRAVVLFYDDEEVIAPIFNQICVAFDGLAACAGKWHIQAAKPVYDLTTWKRQAGASRLIDRKNASLAYQLPQIIKSNITPPVLQAGSRRIYFFPDMALVEANGTFGAVSYQALLLRSQPSNFIEEGSVPRDTEILYHTWQHPNKGGGPDRRFKYNRQLPVCRYELIHLTSDSGLNELFEFSRFGVAQSFASALRNTPKQLKSDIALLPSSSEQESSATTGGGERLLPRWAIASLWLTGLASIGFIFVGLSRMAPPQSPQAAAAPLKPAPQPMFVVAAALNCRSAPSANSQVIKTLSHGENVQVQTEQGSWSEITYDTGNCWSVSRGLSATKPVAKKPVRRKHIKKQAAPDPIAAPESNLPEIY